MTSVSRFITIDGLKLHYLEYGDAASPPIVCIHGLTRSAHDFDALAPHLARRYRVLALDVRGRGESAWGPPARYNIATYADDLGAILDQLGLRRVSLIGTSMGGRISILYAGRNPERVERVVLNDIGPALNPEASAQINQWVTSAPADFANLEEVRAHYRAVQFGPGSDEDFAAMLKWLIKPAAGGRLTWKMDPAIRKPPPGTSPVLPIGFWEEYEKITAPILIVRGALSTVLMPETAARMCRVSSKVRLVEVPGVGHAPSLVEPESLAAIREFFGC
jgi:esterase